LVAALRRIDKLEQENERLREENARLKQQLAAARKLDFCRFFRLDFEGN
jgi:cell division septum initiation protein DivIVA